MLYVGGFCEGGLRGTLRNEDYSVKIAVLALQGAFVEHEAVLRQLGHTPFEVRKLEDWNQPKDGLILPGGESTTMMRLLKDEGLFEPIRQEILAGLPVMGTCAGMILLAKDRLECMDIEVLRNAYGRQLGSFNTVGRVDEVGEDVLMTFIRAPYIQSYQESVRPLAVVDGRTVAARQGNRIACSFHPELTDDTRWHRYFLRICETKDKQ